MHQARHDADSYRPSRRSRAVDDGAIGARRRTCGLSRRAPILPPTYRNSRGATGEPQVGLTVWRRQARNASCGASAFAQVRIIEDAKLSGGRDAGVDVAARIDRIHHAARRACRDAEESRFCSRNSGNVFVLRSWRPERWCSGSGYSEEGHRSLLGLAALFCRDEGLLDLPLLGARDRRARRRGKADPAGLSEAIFGGRRTTPRMRGDLRSGHPSMRFVPGKSADQQSVLMLHRKRDALRKMLRTHLALTWRSSVIVSQGNSGVTQPCARRTRSFCAYHPSLLKY
jgi:hypothetical protein